MPRIAPFVGLRYDPAVAGPIARLVAPPYDMLPDAILRRYLDRSPYNVARLEGGAGGAGEAEYRSAADLLRSWRAGGVLVQTPPSGFAYEMVFEEDGREVRTVGLLAALEVEPWGGSIVPHEKTMAGPVEDRLRLLRAIRANLSPIHAVLHDPAPLLSATLIDAMRGEPLAEATDDEGVLHRVWESPISDAVIAELGSQTCMIADGHHRYTTALAFREEMRASGRGAGPWDSILTLLVDPTEEPPVRPFHRIVREGPFPAPDESVADLGTLLARLDDDVPLVGLAVIGQGDQPEYGLVRLRGAPPAVAALDPLIPGGEKSVRFSHDASEADRAVRMREAAGAWFLPPTTTSRIGAVLDSGERLPRKSTYFWPKPRTGFVLRPLD